MKGALACPSRIAWAALALALALGCAGVPRPEIMAQVDAVRGGASAQEARTYAPAAHAHAEKLHRDAQAAFDAGDLAGAQMLDERALAAFAHASALARIARAEATATTSEGELEKLRAELADLDADQARLGAEADALELRAKVARDAQPVVPSGPADAARERARLDAARALAVQARMLCAAARMLAATPVEGDAAPAPDKELTEKLDAAFADVGAVDAEIAKAKVAPIDAATRARAGCLAALTGVRRARTPIAKAPGAGDALLAELSAAGSAPSRDDRGVVVTLRGAFSGDALSAAGSKALGDLGRVAAAHPAFPVQVVVHADASTPARADAAAKALRAAGAAHVDAVLAGSGSPVVDPSGKDRARNARLEIVFVSPDSF